MKYNGKRISEFTKLFREFREGLKKYSKKYSVMNTKTWYLYSKIR